MGSSQKATANPLALDNGWFTKIIKYFYIKYDKSMIFEVKCLKIMDLFNTMKQVAERIMNICLTLDLQGMKII